VTHREARIKIGSRTNRRRGLKRKNIPGSAKGQNRAQCYRYPRKPKRSLILKVRALVKESAA
jgi:hypothetical protein